MDTVIIATAQRIAGPFLRLSLAIILAWIGALKFVDPTPVVGLLQASLPVNVVLGQELSPRHSGIISSLLMGAAWGLGALLLYPIGALADHAGLEAALAALSSLILVGFVCATRIADRPAAVREPIEFEGRPA